MDLLGLVHLSVVMMSMVTAKRFIDQMQYEDHQRLRNEQFKILSNNDPRRSQQVCTRLTRDPYFSIDMLVGQTWRIYYVWNMELPKECMDMTFRNATRKIIDRIYKEMNEYLDVEPYWDTASVLITMSRARHEMLLFPDPGAAGSFHGVPNIIRDSSIRRVAPPKMTVPLLRFHLKLLYAGKYLLMADCQLGVTTLSARRRAVSTRTEIGGIANSLNFGPGHFACQFDLNKNERLR
ncbi:hypothetical protein PYW08_008302 [Mythimna loreyi]|uniref:Uncharacterized protein n=1 Tax=Mythimna loreyi TaxID=667449 RepID=A0ACC2QAW3_9NEOP|nr:hypothetical protein PYW08_008302 [Mythimna loreyi]